MEHQDPSRHTLSPQGRVYVLRIWHGGAGDAPNAGTPPTWRASVREGTSGPRRDFASIDECIDHLYGELMRR